MFITIFVNKPSMVKRVSVMIDNDLVKKLRLQQAEIIKKENSPYSFSRVVNDYLKKGIK